MSDTIFALASAAGRAGVAVVRISGPEAGPALEALAGRLPAARRATLADLVDPRDGQLLDRGLVLWFPAPGSYTGEDVAELHLHGGRAVVTGVLDALSRLPRLRPAEPGEFTRRAFDAGRIDLTEVEGLADLVEAETRAQVRQALRQMAGGLGRLVEGWRDRLVRALAHLEAALDFPDEDLPGGASDAVAEDVAAVGGEIDRALDDAGRGERLREGLTVAILGAPNVGKSSILNRLAGREAAIVAESAGTTRDVVEVHLDLGGVPVVLADTAGLREAGDAIEAEGVRRARVAGETADLVLLVFAADAPADPASLALVDTPIDGRTRLVVNKTDLGPGPTLPGTTLGVSAETGAGFDALERLLTEAATLEPGGGLASVITRARHRAALTETRDALVRFRRAPSIELAAEDLRLAVRALGRVTGRVDVEDLLDIIFREFCIGK